MKRALLTLCMAAALVSQEITQNSAPASTANLSLSKRIDAETQRLDILKVTNPEQALIEALALIPDPLPAFDKSTFLTTRQSLLDQLAIVQAKFIAASYARVSGKWELASSLFKEASELASVTKTSVKEGLAPMRKQWEDAIVDAKTKIAEVEPRIVIFDENPRFKALDAKNDRTMDENIEYEKFMNAKAELLQPLTVWKNNLIVAPKAFANFDILEKEPDAYVQAAKNNEEKMLKAIATEKAEINRYDEDAKNPIINSKRLKPLSFYIRQRIGQLTEQKVDREMWLYYLNRYRVLDPGNKEVIKKIDWALGNSPTSKGKS